MKKITALLLIAVILVAVLLVAASATAESGTAVYVDSPVQTEYKRGDTVNIPGYSVEGLSEYTADVILFTPNSEIYFLSHEEDGSITSYANNTNLYPASFCVADNAFRAEQKGQYTLRYVVYDKEYNRTASELTFNVN